MKTRILTIIFALTAILTSCNRKALMEEYKYQLAETASPSLSCEGVAILSFDTNSCQLGYSSSKNQFRVSDDYMNNYFILTCDRAPVAGSTVTAELIYTTTNNVKTETGLVFSVESVGSDGMVKLFNEKKYFGAVVKILE